MSSGYKPTREERRKTLKQYVGRSQLETTLRQSISEVLAEVPERPIPYLIKCLRKNSGDYSDVEGHVQEALKVSKAEVLKIIEQHKAAFREDLRAPNILAWNERYQRLLEKCRRFSTADPKEEAIDAWMELYQLHHEFEAAAEAFARVIIQELGLPEQQMTFRPVPRAPNATFSEYICQGIRLTVFTKDALPVGDAVTVFRMKTLAKGLGDLGLKTLGHEKRGIQMLRSVDCQDLSLPLVCTVDYRGVRVLATSAIPHPFGFREQDRGKGSDTVVEPTELLERQLEEMIVNGKKADEVKHGANGGGLPSITFSLYNSDLFHVAGHQSKFGLTPRVSDLDKAKQVTRIAAEGLNVSLTREELIDGGRGFLAKDGRLYFQQNSHILPLEHPEVYSEETLSQRPSVLREPYESQEEPRQRESADEGASVASTHHKNGRDASVPPLVIQRPDSGSPLVNEGHEPASDQNFLLPASQQRQPLPSVRFSTLTDHIILAAELLAERDKETLRIRPEMMKRWPTQLPSGLLPQLVRDADPESYEAKKVGLAKVEKRVQDEIRAKIHDVMIEAVVELLLAKYDEGVLEDVDLSLEMHWRGIPMRYLGLVYALTEERDEEGTDAQKAVLSFVLAEMISRCVKCEVRRRWRDESTESRRLVLPNAGTHPHRQGIPGYTEEPDGVLEGSSFHGHRKFALVLCEVLHFVFGNGPESIVFWRDELCLSLQQKFGYGHAAFVMAIKSADMERQGDDDGIIEHLGYFTRRFDVNMDYLLQRLEVSLGFALLEMARRDLLYVAGLQMHEEEETDAGLSPSDVFDIRSVIKSTGTKSFCKGAFLLFEALVGIRSWNDEGNDTLRKSIRSPMRLRRVVAAGTAAFTQAHVLSPSDDLTLYRWGEFMWACSEVGKLMGDYDDTRLEELSRSGDELFAKASLIHIRRSLFNQHVKNIKEANFEDFAELEDQEVMKLLDLYKHLATREGSKPLSVSFRGCVRLSPDAIASWITAHPKLRSVDLRGITIGTIGVETLTGALRENGTLLQILLTPERNMDPSTAVAFATQCYEHMTLEAVVLSKVWELQGLRSGFTTSITYFDLPSVEEGNEPVDLTPFEAVFAVGLASCCQHLKSFSLRCDCGGLSPEGATAAAPAFAEAKIDVVDLEDNMLTADGETFTEAEELLRALFSNPSLLGLRIGSNALGEAFRGPSETLLGNTSLKELRVESNNLSDRDVEFLAKALAGEHKGGGVEANKALEIVDLRNNDIGGEVAKMLLSAVNVNTRLRVLDLRDNAGVAPSERDAAEAVLKERQ